jgi:hypothetical protein
VTESTYWWIPELPDLAEAVEEVPRIKILETMIQNSAFH